MKKAARGLLALQDRLMAEPVRYAFILAHMRSGSTLLNHILMSHPEILGCGERNATYDGPESLSVLRLRAYAYHRQFLRPPRYVVDQINHDRFFPDAGLLDHPQVRTIFLIRRPLAAVSSMVRVLGAHYGTTLEEAVHYYVARLDSLSGYASGLARPENAIFLSYESLVDDTPVVLRHLSGCLDLSSPISERYEQFEFTGERGDPGPNIRLGIVAPHRGHAPVEIPPVFLERLDEAYARCHETLASCVWRGMSESPAV